jgi:hypothetical protein
MRGIPKYDGILKEITKQFRVDAAPKGKMITCMQKLACCNPNPKASPELLLMRCSLWDINLVAKNKKGYSIKVLMKQSGIQTSTNHPHTTYKYFTTLFESPNCQHKTMPECNTGLPEQST